MITSARTVAGRGRSRGRSQRALRDHRRPATTRCRCMARRRGLDHVEIEIRRDLIGDAAGQAALKKWASGGRHPCQVKASRRTSEARYTPSSSTSKISVALGGMTPPAPRAVAELGRDDAALSPPTSGRQRPHPSRGSPGRRRVGPNGEPRSTELENFLPFIPIRLLQPTGVMHRHVVAEVASAPVPTSLSR